MCDRCRATNAQQRLEEAVLLELMKMPVADRLTQVDRFRAGRFRASALEGTFTLPSTWRYYDEETVEYLLDLFAEQCKLEVKE